MKDFILHTTVNFSIVFFLLCALCQAEEKIPTELRYIRSFGGDNELAPPVYVISKSNSPFTSKVGSEFVTIELDVFSEYAPAMYAILVHCNADWTEDNNAFLNDPTKTRTSNFQWDAAPTAARYFTFRGILRVPDIQTKILFGGNWKVKIYDYDSQSDIPFAEARFFVVDPLATAEVQLFPDVYTPLQGITPTAYTIDVVAQGSNTLFDLMQNMAVVYKNHRWMEPIVITAYDDEDNEHKWRYRYQTSVTGTISFLKRFRVEKVPTENEYRVFDLNNLAFYPNASQIARQQMTDLPRNGSFTMPDNDGAFYGRFVSAAYDEYLPVEFVFDPEFRGVSKRDVFVVGSCNNWNPDRNWIMSYNKEKRYYTLRAMLRRGMHDYMYVTGEINSDNGTVEKLDYTEYEGNTSISNNSYLGVVYYKDQNYGGFDTIIAIGSSNPNVSLQR
ncbi:MAG TPA: DUF5103 domain-containing protein [Candidatus Kapabacteria bacterium]|nr:DUF5103 domain-containing protein [Candidatus Kapabacteria bacterium]